VRGLTLSEEKTHIRHIRQGFDFLGQNLRKYSHGKLWITPSKKNVKTLLTKVRDTIKKCRGHNLGVVIGQLNPKIRDGPTITGMESRSTVITMWTVKSTKPYGDSSKGATQINPPNGFMQNTAEETPRSKVAKR
jgi:hypothetical protein